MADNMFCFQCEQTAGCKGCMGKAGVCGKTALVANLQDVLTKAMLGLASAVDTPDEKVVKLVRDGLFTTVTNVNFNEETLKVMIDEIKAETDRRGGSRLSCTDDKVEPLKLWSADEDSRSLKSLILFGLRGMAAYAYHAEALGYTDKDVDGFFFEGLKAMADVDATMETLLPVVMKVGEVNFKCMELLDRANTESYGTPVPTTVTLTVEKGPFIVVT